jgi:hypothetical protein
MPAVKTSFIPSDSQNKRSFEMARYPYTGEAVIEKILPLDLFWRERLFPPRPFGPGTARRTTATV